jgi:hypothetical protein
MRAFALTLGISAATLAGDIDFGGVGQTVVTSNDGDYSLDTRLVLGGYAESDGAVYGFSFETIDNLDDVALLDAYVGVDLDIVNLTVGKFQRHFGAELESTRFRYNYGLTRATTFVEDYIEGVSFGGELGDLSFNIDAVGSDVFDNPGVGGRVELGALGVGFADDNFDLWTADVSWEDGFISYTDDSGDWTACLQTVLIPVGDCFTTYGRVEHDWNEVTEYAIGGKLELKEDVNALVEYDSRDEAVRGGLRFTF